MKGSKVDMKIFFYKQLHETTNISNCKMCRVNGIVLAKVEWGGTLVKTFLYFYRIISYFQTSVYIKIQRFKPTWFYMHIFKYILKMHHFWDMLNLSST